LNPQVWIVGLTIAIVASIETLLCIEAADRMDVHKRYTDTNVELKAQGIGNIFAYWWITYDIRSGEVFGK
jgi:MFS superfamily sulfate permease-like transporter